MTMGKRPPRGFAEQDAFTSWRRVLCYLDRPGVVKKLKRQAHKKDRRQARKDIRDDRR